MSTILEYNPIKTKELNPSVEELYIKPSNLEAFSSYYTGSGKDNKSSFPIKYLIVIISITLLVGFWLLWKTTNHRRKFILNSGHNFY